MLSTSLNRPVPPSLASPATERTGGFLLTDSGFGGWAGRNGIEDRRRNQLDAGMIGIVYLFTGLDAPDACVDFNVQTFTSIIICFNGNWL
ncbi:hypothetical protein V496_07688 [Pseudogymnoascus sp. VKM F-4515 (FW-2607)]|nr:hypothetical protein V496_07688 [Pseudogymnoascus sp. VKM F-4515 (FW-2607)]